MAVGTFWRTEKLRLESKHSLAYSPLQLTYLSSKCKSIWSVFQHCVNSPGNVPSALRGHR